MPDAFCPLSLGLDRMDNTTAPAKARPVLRMALVLYGLVRHRCTEANFEQALIRPLRHVPAASFAVETYVAANVLTSNERGDRGPPGSWGRAKSYHPLPQTEYARFHPCHSSAVDQLEVSYDVGPILNATCGQYGDAWGDVTCKYGLIMLSPHCAS